MDKRKSPDELVRVKKYLGMANNKVSKLLAELANVKVSRDQWRELYTGSRVLVKRLSDDFDRLSAEVERLKGLLNDEVERRR